MQFKLQHSPYLEAFVIIDRPICPDGQVALTEVSTSPCLAASRPYILAATILASAMGFIDGSVVTIALPSIESDLSAPFQTIQWVVNGYTLTLGSVILIGGAAGDRYGRRHVFLIGIAIFTLASIACALAPSVTMLVVARLLQGCGAALMVPQSLAIISASFPKTVRGQAIGLWAAASAITTALGPLLGGLLIDALSWRAAFWINLPIACAVIWLTLTHVPESRNETETGELDWLGGLLVVVALGALARGLSLASASSPLSLPVLTSFGIAALAFLLFRRRENRASQPLLPPALLQSREFTAANLLTLLLYGAFAAILFLLPFDLIARRGLSASEAGVLLLPIGLVVGTASRTAGRWADRVGPRLPLSFGSALVALAATLLAFSSPNLWLGALGPILLMAIGMAMVVAPLTTAVMNAVPEAESGIASAVNNAASRLAGLISVVVVALAASLLYRQEVQLLVMNGAQELRFGVLPDPSSPARAPLEAAFLEAYGVAMLIAAALAGLAAVAGAVLVRPKT
jgi:EmrB/QacA subfamily drug resistance transporter